GRGRCAGTPWPGGPALTPPAALCPRDACPLQDGPWGRRMPSPWRWALAEPSSAARQEGVDMSSTGPPVRRLSSAAWRRCEQLVLQFEEAWRGGARRALEGDVPEDAELRQAALVELAHTELELRLDHGQPARAEDYLARFPQLAADPALAVELVAAEFALRRARGEEPQPQE